MIVLPILVVLIPKLRISRDGDQRSNPMPITVPNYNRKTDRLQLGTLIAITSES